MPKWRLLVLPLGPNADTHIVRQHLRKENKWQLYWDRRWTKVPLDGQGNPDYTAALLYAKAKERDRRPVD